VTADGVTRQLEKKRVFVVEHDGEVAATGALADFGSPEHPKHTVSQFFVRPDLHGRGIGTRLLVHLTELAEREGIRQLHVPSSRNAIAFYRRAGFEEDMEQPSTDREITWMTRRLR
jgi:GNAT superfamily N-acetyltransferase